MATVIYEGEYGRNVLGRLDDNGMIYDKFDNAIGRIESDGTVYGNPTSGLIVGWIASDGGVYDDLCGGNFLGNGVYGGNIYSAIADCVVAHAEGDDIPKAAGAALILLLN